MGSPGAVLAPMVEGSVLPLRMLCRKYGVTLAYTPMIHSLNFLKDLTYRSKVFATCPGDTPLVAQFCGNDPNIMASAASLLISGVGVTGNRGSTPGIVEAVDINIGCPQKIAKRGGYGAFIMHQPDLVREIVETMSKRLKVPVFCKMRLFPTLEESINFAKMLEAAGCKLLAVHGRQKSDLRPDTPPDWPAIGKIVEQMKIPVIANGGVKTLEDAITCKQVTKADGVMVGLGLLRNPALFSPVPVPDYVVARDFVSLCRQLSVPAYTVRGLLIKMCLTNLGKFTHLRDELPQIDIWEQADEILNQLEKCEKGEATTPSKECVVQQQTEAGSSSPKSISIMITRTPTIPITHRSSTTTGSSTTPTDINTTTTTTSSPPTEALPTTLHIKKGVITKHTRNNNSGPVRTGVPWRVLKVRAQQPPLSADNSGKRKKDSTERKWLQVFGVGVGSLTNTPRHILEQLAQDIGSQKQVDQLSSVFFDVREDDVFNALCESQQLELHDDTSEDITEVLHTTSITAPTTPAPTIPGSNNV
ncbi:FMN-linked oxidoreductases superfamily protein [Pelomyxa schiedti]|nr:FMN-linked oxidoreductases superfamily protein [Pelomyxa schiedti]